MRVTWSASVSRSRKLWAAALGRCSMTDTDPSKTPVWPAWPMWPFWLQESPAPTTSDDFVQPINPGWTFGNLISVTEQNSSAPDTERDIVSVESYGRQLGVVIDALAELIKGRSKSASQTPSLNELLALRDKIEKIKLKSAERRLDRIATDLAELRKSDKSEYRRLAQKLRKAMDDKD